MVGPLPKTLSNNAYILTAIDWYSGYVEAWPLPDKKADGIAHILLDELFPRYGAALQLVTDNGSEFCNSTFRKVCEGLNIHHVRTTPYTPWSNGKIERSHRALIDVISKKMQDNNHTWDLYLNQALAAIRFSINETILTDQNEILKETELFYKNLYTKKQDNSDNIEIDNYFENSTIPKLSETESEKLEGLLSYAEISDTLLHMKNDKSPGLSGFSADFFKVFWKQLGYFVLRSLNYGYQMGNLSITQKQGIITCIPKENKPKQFLKNWRPLTLLDTVYKIASGSIAKRLKLVLPDLISNDQTGFLKGRFIGENTRLIYDMLQYTEENNIPGLLILIDFEKAFDSLSWSFIHKALKFLNFGNSFRKWIEVFYSNINSAVIQNGYLSSFFQISRGCRQGDPLSPYIFIICAEFLANKIRKNKNIKGIKVGTSEHKISQYADDTSIFLDGSEKSLEELLKELEYFALISGLKVNFDKTQLVWIGSKKFDQTSIKTKWKLIWGKQTFKLLGINFNTDYVYHDLFVCS